MKNLYRIEKKVNKIYTNFKKTTQKDVIQRAFNSITTYTTHILTQDDYDYLTRLDSSLHTSEQIYTRQRLIHTTDSEILIIKYNRIIEDKHDVLTFCTTVGDLSINQNLLQNTLIKDLENGQNNLKGV